MKKINLVIVMFMVLFVPVFARAENVTTKEDVLKEFSRANSLYKEGQFESAIKEYERVLESGFRSGALYFNLANAYYRLGSKEKALLNYKRAKRLSPRDRDLKYNLRFVQRQLNVSDKESADNIFARLAQKYSRNYTTEEMSLMALIAFILLAVSSLLLLYFRKNIWWQVICVFVFSIFIGINVFGIYGHIQEEEGAAIVLKRTETSFEPKMDATKHFLLKGGEQIKIKQVQGEWTKVERKDKKQGWVLSEVIEQIIN